MSASDKWSASHTPHNCQWVPHRCCLSAVLALAPPLPPRRWYDLVLAAREDIAVLMTLESGKPLAESKAEFDNGWVQGGADGAFARGRHSSSEARMLAAGQSGAEKRDSSLPRSVASIEWFAEEAKRTCGDVMEAPDRQRRFLVGWRAGRGERPAGAWLFAGNIEQLRAAPQLEPLCTRAAGAKAAGGGGGGNHALEFPLQVGGRTWRHLVEPGI